MGGKPVDFDGFVTLVLAEGARLYRDFPWRVTRDPYAVLVSEVMLQQTQVARVERRFDDWLGSFPTIEALAAAPLEAVLESWQGLGYHRRAVALHRAARQLVADAGPGAQAVLPPDEAALVGLPGIGPATAAGVLAFAYDLPAIYLETNVRAVVLHELMADREGVPDKDVRATLVSALEVVVERGVSPRTWYYALLDYGAHLKRELPNPSRRSAHHTRQSRFEGSRRQKRAWLLRAVLANPGAETAEHVDALSTAEVEAGRDPVAPLLAEEILDALAAEGFVVCRDGRWFVA